jgi:hypothetical protein
MIHDYLGSLGTQRGSFTLGDIYFVLVNTSFLSLTPESKRGYHSGSTGLLSYTMRVSVGALRISSCPVKDDVSNAA